MKLSFPFVKQYFQITDLPLQKEYLAVHSNRGAPDNIRTPQNDDDGIDMPSSDNDVERWLKVLDLIK